MTENADALPREERISVRDAQGRTAEWHVRHAPSATMSDAGLVSSRIMSDTGLIAVKRWIPEDLAQRGARAGDELEREVMAGVRLLDRYPVDRYPAELVRLIGYNLDDVEPFVLVSPVRGTPFEESGQLRPDAREAFELSLLRGLVHLAEAGVTHHGLTPATVYWDGIDVQIRDFGKAIVAGRSGEPSANGQAGGGADIWSAGLLILRAATGRNGLVGPEMLEGRGQALRDLLDGVFDEVPSARPAAECLLGRLNVTVRLPQEDLGAWQRFEEGRIRFDETLRAKWPAPPAPPPPPPPPPVRRRRWSFGTFAYVGMVLATMAGAALWVVSAR